MVGFGIGIAVVLALWWIAQAIPVWLYTRQFRNPQPAGPIERPLPKIAVTMPVRAGGADLADAIGSILDQDYSNFELFVVIDSWDDPAWRVATEVIERRGADNVHLSVLQERHESCGLVCSSLLQCLDNLDESFELITFCAADTILPRAWLRELVTAVAEPGVGGTLGNRWYVASGNPTGSLVQYLWNAGAVVPMWLYQIPWAGALAVRLSDVQRSQLESRWRETIVEDTPVKDALESVGLKMQFSPQLMVSMDEAVTLDQSYRFIKRQMLWTRLYHPQWNLVVANALAGTLSVVGPPAFAVVSAFLGEWSAAGWAAGGWMAYLFGLLMLTGGLDRAVGRVFKSRGENVRGLDLATCARLLWAIPFTQVLYMGTVVSAIFAREVEWSGVKYRLEGRRVELVSYQPVSGLAMLQPQEADAA